MKINKLLSTFIFLMTCHVSATDALSPVGLWKTIDDETKKEKSIVEIYEIEGKLHGKIIKIFKAPEEDQNPKCDKCKGDMKDQPVIGLEILKKLKKSSDTTWNDGDITDPNNGKTYSCKIEMIESGNKLNVRGFIGFSLLGRTQVWEKQPAK